MSVLSDTEYFYKSFGGEKGVAGYSEDGRPIYFVAVKKTARPVILAQYAMHAREYVTAYLAALMAEDFAKRGVHGTVYFLPAVNPDGIEIAENVNPLYKANGRGVDLNVNFDARWGTGAKNVKTPGAENYIGERPFSESESRALRDFTFKTNPDMTLSYHSKGEVIYWEFFQQGERQERDLKIAKKVSQVTGYPLGDAGISAGGYKDWCVEKLHIPALTLEVGEDYLAHPISPRQAGKIFEKHRNVLSAVTEMFFEGGGF